MKTNSVKSLLSEINYVLDYKGNLEIEPRAFGFSHANTELDLCTFVESEQYLSSLPSNTKVLITKPGIDFECECVIYTEFPRDVFYNMHDKFSNNIATNKLTEISKYSNISEDAKISDYGVIIKEGVTIEAGAIIKSNVVIEENSIIRSGSIIGGAGFQMHSFNEAGLQHIEHYGSVRIGKNVEIQQNSCIDKAIFAWDTTSIGDNTKIASLVEIAHACTIGRNILIASGVNVGGRVTIGNNSWLGLSAVISNGITIGDNAKVSLGSVVTQDVESGIRVTGNFAIEHDKFIKNLKGQVK